MPISSEADVSEPTPPTRRPRRAVLVTHEACGADDTGAVRTLLAERGFDVTHHSVFPHGEARDAHHPLPDAESADLVVVFGSFAHAWEPRHREWVGTEVAWVRRVLERDTPFVGICFGGQLLAEAWGGSVEAGDGAEIGMLTFATDPGCPIPGGPWFSWHSDRVVLPPDVDVWSRSDFGPQIFTRGRAVGVQFHPEVTVALVDSWLRSGEEDSLERAHGTQRLRDSVDADIDASQANLRKFLDWVIATWV
ncbi:type 1 glutamine amidotransferase [Streptomycetaceae bacterium NBC_01309]